MKIFISWSGDLSKAIAEILRKWLPNVIQSVEPYFTPSDIEKGSRWLHGISKELDECSVGIFCITQYNLKSEWVLFEAGAISKSVKDKSRVCPLLFDILPGDLPSPLQQFQATLFKKEDIRKLLIVINSATDSGRLSDNVLNDVFEKWWPDLDADIRAEISRYQPATPPKKKTELELLSEILQITQFISAQNASLPIVTLSRESKQVFTCGTLPVASGSRNQIYFVVDAPPDGKYGACYSDGKHWHLLRDVELEN